MDFREKPPPPLLPVNSKVVAAAPQGHPKRVETRSSILPFVRKLLGILLVVVVTAHTVKVFTSRPKHRRPFGKAAEEQFL